jgi:prolyl-tRNA synthetase
MRLSSYFLPTLIETPQEAETLSHKLMLRAGLIDKTSAGIYSFLPLGLRVLQKVEKIIREEMNAIGAIELSMPALTPASLWKETGRWREYGDDMFRLKDRKSADFGLAPTHEEIVCDIVRGRIKSYKKLPLLLYQIQTKFRDEPRPRSGTIRCREFVMKDAYSFHSTEESCEETYKAFYDAYCRIFDRCGFSYGVVEAEAGLIGGSFSHEFIAWAESGEDKVMVCDSCGYSANLERAEIGENARSNVQNAKCKEPKTVETPGLTKVSEVAEFLGIEPERLIKTLIYKADGEPIAVLIRGTDELNETKLKRALQIKTLEMADTRLIEEVTGAPLGFSGPIGLKVKSFADNAIRDGEEFVVGANKADAHIVGAACGRDFSPEGFFDLVFAKEGDPCPRCDGLLSMRNGIELGHTFKLGTKYSEAMRLCFLDKDGREKAMVMGCYGIGVTRIVPAIIEQKADTRGIVWPKALAPYQAVVIAIDIEKRSLAEEVYDKLKDEIELLYDDRQDSPGKKFADADLIGIPWQIIIGKKASKEKIELCERSTKKREFVCIDRLAEVIR